MNAQPNPLLDFSGLTRFDAIAPDHVSPALDHLLADARSAVERVATDQGAPSWESIVEPLTEAFDKLERAWNAVSHLNAVVNTQALREAYHANLPKLTSFYTEVGQDLRLFRRYRALHDAPAFNALDAAQRRAIGNELRDFKLGGAELPATEKERFKAVQQQLADLSAQFDDNVLDATNAWSHFVTDAADLDGIPADVVSEARAAAEAEGRAGYKLTLLMPCFLPVIQYARNRALRQTLHRGYATRASELGEPPTFDNRAIVGRILELRHEEAQLLGYANFAEVSLVPKMAQTPAEVLAFLRDLNRRARPFALAEFAELAKFARDELGLAELAPWDIAYAAEQLKTRRYAFSEQELKQYFPEHKVLAGLFRVVETIFAVHVREVAAPVWHPTVRFFEIVDVQGKLVGQFYFDLYAREGKQGGAWMGSAINRRRIGGSVQHPVVFMTCNLPAPVAGRPATFTHDDVITLFHEFGHGLHQLLTEVDIAGVSGLQGVEWDAIELPSQFMENYCWEYDVLRHMTAHVDTGAPLPRALFDSVLASKNFEGGMATVRQLQSGLFDMLLHSEYTSHDAQTLPDPAAVLAAARAETAVGPMAPYDRSTYSFGHLFAGGYAAGYYSYKWAEVLSADAYSLFEEQGVLSAEVGARFRSEVLARGGSRPALESFVAFRGRAPQLDALLRHNGMVSPL